MKEVNEIKINATDGYIATRAKIEQVKKATVEKVGGFLKKYLSTKKDNALNVEKYITILNEDGFDFTVTLIGVNENGEIYVRGHYDNGATTEVELKSEPHHYESFLILFNTIHIIVTTEHK